MQAVREDGMSRIVLAWVLVVLSILVATGSAGLWVYSAFYPSKTVSSTHPAFRKTLQSTPTSTTGQQANAITRKYMQAFITHDYAMMWTMLHPQMQAMWPNQAAFEAYWQRRFQGYTLQSFTLGTPDQLAQWVDPETMVQYDKVMRIPVSLRLTLQQRQAQT